MLKHLARRRIKPLVLGIDWQIDSLRIVLLGGANTTNHQGQQQLLGQWHLSLPLLSVSDPMREQAEWQDFMAQVASLLGNARLHINVQLHYQRMAAAALNIEPVNLRVCHVQLSSNLSFLVVTKRHYDDHIGQLISSLHDAVKGSVIGCIEPQGLTKVLAPAFLDDGYAMAWFMANKARLSPC